MAALGRTGDRRRRRAAGRDAGACRPARRVPQHPEPGIRGRGAAALQRNAGQRSQTGGRLRSSSDLANDADRSAYRVSCAGAVPAVSALCLSRRHAAPRQKPRAHPARQNEHFRFGQPALCAAVHPPRRAACAAGGGGVRGACGDHPGAGQHLPRLGGCHGRGLASDEAGGADHQRRRAVFRGTDHPAAHRAGAGCAGRRRRDVSFHP